MPARDHPMRHMHQSGESNGLNHNYDMSGSTYNRPRWLYAISEAFFVSLRPRQPNMLWRATPYGADGEILQEPTVLHENAHHMSALASLFYL